MVIANPPHAEATYLDIDEDWWQSVLADEERYRRMKRDAPGFVKNLEIEGIEIGRRKFFRRERDFFQVHGRSSFLCAKE